jgi:hypothetical protein
MSEKIRIGNDLDIRWTIVDGDENPYILEGRDITLELNVGKKRVRISEFELDQNTIHFVYYGKDQKYTGSYILKFIENDGNVDMVTFDTPDAFTLVEHSWLANVDPGEVEDRVYLEFTTVTSELMERIGPRGYSAYEVALQNGFVGTEEEWLASLKGEQGNPAGFGTVEATVDANVGVPSVEVAATGPDTAKNFSFAFHNLKGVQGNPGDAAGFDTPLASIDDGTGTPSVEVTASGPNTAKVFNFAFHNLKGSPGGKGDPGDSAGFGTIEASVDANVGTPSVEVSTSGPDTAKNIAFVFHNLKGVQGDPGTAAGFGTPQASVDANTGTPSVEIVASGPDTAKIFSFIFHNLKGAKGDPGVAVWGSVSGDINNQTDLKNALDGKMASTANLADLNNVSSTSPSDGQALIWDGTNSVWKPGAAGSPDAVKYTSQSLTSEQQAQARTNIGAGTSNFSGAFGDLSGKPTTIAGYGITDAYTKTEVDGLVASVFKPAGSASSVAGLGALTAANVGKVYNMSAAFTTTSDFLEGAGVDYPAGTNVVIVEASANTYKYDVFSGVVDLSGYAQKATTLAGYGITDAKIEQGVITLGNQSITPLTSHQDISGKADKDTDAVEGNFASFDANGNPVDSGHKHSDYLTSHQDISGKADKVSGAISGHFAGLDGNGNLTDSGKSASDFVASTEKLVKYSSQSLSSSEQAQARTNIGAGTSSFSGAFGDLSGKPTTISGYGITDAKIEQNVITLGSNTITVPDLTDYTDQELQTAIDTAFANL